MYPGSVTLFLVPASDFSEEAALLPLTELKKILLLIDYQFTIQGRTQKHQIKEMHRARGVGGGRASTACPGLSPTQHHYAFTDWELSEPFLWVSMEASLHWHDRCNHWALATDSTSRPSPLPRGQGKRCGPLSVWLSSLTTSPHSEEWAKRQPISITKDNLSTEGIPRVLGKLCARMGGRPNAHFLLPKKKNNNITGLITPPLLL